MKYALILTFFLLLSVSAQAQIAGSDLIKGKEAFQKLDLPGTRVDFEALSFFRGYVSGVAEMSSIDTSALPHFCMPSGVTGKQILTLVSGWLDQHPESWHKPAVLLVTQSLSNAFPCSKTP